MPGRPECEVAVTTRTRSQAQAGTSAGQQPGVAIRLRDVTRRYAVPDGDPAAVAGIFDVDLDIGGGDLVAIMGPSGSGKTTLLNVIAALDRADAGKVEVGGTDLATAAASVLSRFRRDTVGVVFQDSVLIPELDVVGNIAMPAMLAGDNRRRAARRARELLARLQLASLHDRPPGKLSGGQRQQVALARALVNRPSLLLADEPTGSLDSASGARLVALLEEVTASGTTVILVTHDDAVAAHAHRVVRLLDGRLR